MPPPLGQTRLIPRLGGDNYVKSVGYWRNTGAGVFCGGSVGSGQVCKPWLREVPVARFRGCRNKFNLESTAWENCQKCDD